MSTYVPDAVQAGLDAARISRLKRASKLRIETADGYFRVLRLWDGGFSVSSDDAPKLRGLVDIHEGSMHLFQCLIVASREDADQMHYEYKRMTAVVGSAPRDFVEDADAPVALLSPAPATG
ncbi:MAG: hypothetical protein AAF754_04910 [Pseudomonadota bacterium]